MTSEVTFDPIIPERFCDGMLCWGPCTEELLRYRGPRAWYYAEPRRFSITRDRHFDRALRKLKDYEFLHHSNPNTKFRIPCVTHYGPITLSAPNRSKFGIVAIVSNFGGRLWYFKSEARLRELVYSSRVRLTFMGISMLGKAFVEILGQNRMFLGIMSENGHPIGILRLT